MHPPKPQIILTQHQNVRITKILITLAFYVALHSFAVQDLVTT